MGNISSLYFCLKTVSISLKVYPFFILAIQMLVFADGCNYFVFCYITMTYCIKPPQKHIFRHYRRANVNSFYAIIDLPNYNE